MGASKCTSRAFKPINTVLIDISTGSNPGTYARIDVDDAARVSRHVWQVDSNGYARAEINGKAIRMHNFILDVPSDEICDHINRDTLDNRRCNLRAANSQQNAANRGPIHCKRYKGVYFNRQMEKYEARIKHRSRSVYLGLFDQAESAARMYDRAASLAHGEFAYLNFGIPEMTADEKSQMLELLAGRKRKHVRLARYLGPA